MGAHYAPEGRDPETEAANIVSILKPKGRSAT